jgi:tetratricopeptide (TPR) repeat protein
VKSIKYLSIILFVALVLPTFLSAGFPVHEYTQAIEASPDDMKYKFYLLRGKAYKDSGEMNFALKDLNTSIRLNPGMTAYKYRGEVYFEMERYGDAINDFTTALEFNPTIELYKKRLESYMKSINYVLALADGLIIIDMAPHKAESYYGTIEALENLGDIKLARELAFKVTSFDRGNKRANEIITKYPLKFIFIGKSPFILYISREDKVARDRANEIFLKYIKSEKRDENLKNKLQECVIIGEKISQYQERLNIIFDNYFEEVRSLTVRSRKIHDTLRNKYLEQSGAIEHEIDIWENESEKCTEELIKTYWRDK